MAKKTIIALGANLGDPASTFDAAETVIELRVGRITARSLRRYTEPLLDPVNPLYGQPLYLNSVVMVEPELSCEGIMQELLRIERELGRVRAAKWGPRLIDLDLIAFDEQLVETEDLIVPHPQMHKRRFVLEPFVEIWPDWRHPILGKTAFELLAVLNEE